MEEENTLLFFLFFALGAFFSFVGYSLYIQKKISSLSDFSTKKEEDSERKAQEILKKAELEADLLLARRMQETENRLQDSRARLEKEERRLREREDRFDERFLQIEKKWQEIEKKELFLQKTERKLEQKAQLFHEKETALEKELENLSQVTQEEAEKKLFSLIEQKKRASWDNLLSQKKELLEKNADQEASRLLATAASRIVGRSIPIFSTEELSLPSTEIRGRIIGREGKNIQLLEKLTGTTLIVEDKSNQILISCYDPYRRKIAKEALSMLILDGRIHPTSIEEALHSAKKNVEAWMKKRADEVCHRLTLTNISPALQELLSLSSLRTSLGQNILDHLLEVATFMGTLAAELSCDVQLAKRMGLLHDIGKMALDQEGPHDLVGAEIAKRAGESDKVVNAIASHHGKVAPQTTEAILLKSADALSAGRPGARSEITEKIASREALMERLSLQFEGVDRAFSLKAGRELHLFLDAKKVPENEIEALGYEIRNSLSKNSGMSGPLKLVLLREARAIEL
jgi:ribonuclease Y